MCHIVLAGLCQQLVLANGCLFHQIAVLAEAGVDAGENQNRTASAKNCAIQSSKSPFVMCPLQK